MNKIAANIVKGFFGRLKSVKNNQNESELGWLKHKLVKHQEDEKIKKIRLNGFDIYYQRPYELLHTYHDLFEKGLYSFQTTDKNPVIIDCGSNIGLAVLYFKKCFPHSTIIAFEPDETNYSILETNINKNGLQKVQLHKAAVWINDGSITFNSKGSEGSHITENETGIKVPCISLSNFLAQYDQIAFLKMDIEGAEYEVIKDCAGHLAKVENLFLEYHGKATETKKLEELFSILTAAGFSIYIKNAADNLQHPFRQKMTGEAYDVQLNLFCYR